MKLGIDQIVVGTSAWGSRIPVRRALSLGRALLGHGIRRFDTAPTYGSGYAHYILNRLAYGEKTRVVVDTKYGHLNEFGLRGWAKKILRAPSPQALCNACWQHETTDRDAPGFWAATRILSAFDRARKDLSSCEIDAFYLHGPPETAIRSALGSSEVLDVCEGLKTCGTILGIAEANYDIGFLATIPGERNLRVQTGLFDFLQNRAAFEQNSRTEVHINGLFRDRNRVEEELKLSSGEVDAILSSWLAADQSRRVVIGINSMRSVERAIALTQVQRG